MVIHDTDFAGTLQRVQNRKRAPDPDRAPRDAAAFSAPSTRRPGVSMLATRGESTTPAASKRLGPFGFRGMRQHGSRAVACS